MSGTPTRSLREAQWVREACTRSRKTFEHVYSNEVHQ